MSDAAKIPPRPLSPHLQVWRWHITMACSILHRVSVFALYFAALVLVGWLLALAAGSSAYMSFASVAGSPIGLLVLAVTTFLVFYLLAYNVRQAFWDLGHGFTPKTADTTGLACIAVAAVATLGVWGLVLTRGAA
jgi:succinate dehydrogenase / fumarate reductase cytochrome b subunit